MAKQQQVARQIKLPLSKAVEIAWKSIKLRLSRSLIVTSSIVLALAFLVSIQAGEAITDGMRQWMTQTVESDAYVQLQEERAELSARQKQQASALLKATRGVGGDTGPPNEKLLEVQGYAERFGRLPASAEVIARAAAADTAAQNALNDWVAVSTDLEQVQSVLSRPTTLRKQLELAGVPLTDDAIAAATVQNRWLLGLALLVAFVGILNAMLMSVTERFREIGTMKCLGALDGFIVKLFIIESLFQGTVGTLLGVLLGLGLSLLMAATNYGGFAFENLLWGRMLLAAGISLVVGVALTVAGAVYPAWQAARMEPIEAMRSDV
ncbi:MAG: ABC transporter permease [Phycisphaerae bacterium]